MFIFKPRKKLPWLKILAGFAVVAVAAAGTELMWRWAKGVFSAAETSGGASARLEEARNQLGQNKLAEARAALEPIAASSPKSPVVLEALMLLASIDRKEDKNDEALAKLERAYRDFSACPEHPRATVAYAQALEAANRQPDAVRLYEEVRDNAPPEMRAPALTGLGRQAERTGDLAAAARLFRQAQTDARWDSPESDEALDALGRVNVARIFSPAPTPESKIYVLQKGDSLTSIGNALNTTLGLLMRANGVDEDTRLALGRQFKYTPKDFRIVIERATCRLFLLDKDGIFKRYGVGLGKPGHETTLGSYKLGNKEKNPIWHKPGEEPIPAGDPRNELGTRWMPLVPERDGLPTDLGIHGTIRPETVGKYTSNGCARLLPQDVEELYDLVVRSTPVEIVDTFAGPGAPPPETQPAAAAPPGSASTGS